MPVSRSEQRSRLVTEALRVLDEDGPHALAARSLTARVGASTQALYTLFGGMPGLVDAVVEEGFDRMTRHIDAVPETDDPVADHCVRGLAYCDWALAHAPLYRLMFGVVGAGGSATRSGVVTGSPERLGPQARRGLELLEQSVQRMIDAGRIRPGVDTETVARQFLSATHGCLLLDLGDVFGERGNALFTLGSLGVALLVGHGDAPADAERSLIAATARFTAGGGPRTG